MENFRTNVKCNWVNNELIVARKNRYSRLNIQEMKKREYICNVSISNPTCSLSEILDIYSQTPGVVFESNKTK
jgi:hypothetical protein